MFENALDDSAAVRVSREGEDLQDAHNYTVIHSTHTHQAALELSDLRMATIYLFSSSFSLCITMKTSLYSDVWSVQDQRLCMQSMFKTNTHCYGEDILIYFTYFVGKSLAYFHAPSPPLQGRWKQIPDMLSATQTSHWVENMQLHNMQICEKQNTKNKLRFTVTVKTETPFICMSRKAHAWKHKIFLFNTLC